MPLRIDLLTTFPEMFGVAAPAALAVSIPARARAAGLVEWHATDIRAYAANKHAKTDDRPFGGGPGMVMTCQPLWDAVHAAEALDPRPATRILMTPQGRPLTQAMVEELARLPRLLLIAGHYEGIDERVIEKLAPMEISVGDYVLSGGELAAMVLIDAVVRLLPGALGDEESAVTESFTAVEGIAGGQSNRARQQGASVSDARLSPLADARGSSGTETGPRLLDCPHYPRPREWMGVGVPEVLISGNHQDVARWRLAQRLKRTRERRPDLLEGQGAGG